MFFAFPSICQTALLFTESFWKERNHGVDADNFGLADLMVAVVWDFADVVKVSSLGATKRRNFFWDQYGCNDIIVLHFMSHFKISVTMDGTWILRSNNLFLFFQTMCFFPHIFSFHIHVSFYCTHLFCLFFKPCLVFKSCFFLKHINAWHTCRLHWPLWVWFHVISWISLDFYFICARVDQLPILGMVSSHL